MTRLLRQQIAFMRAVPRLIDKAFELGYDVTGGDLFRDPRAPYGSKSSSHRRRLALDLNLFKNGIYLKDAQSHLPLGEFWESLGGIWGGRFGDDPVTPAIEGYDANHYQWPD